MSCSPFDLRDYFLKELSGAEKKQVDLHVRACSACREELDRLRLTEATLLSLREEEIPQRIAFVSDKVFEPSAWRRAWASFWGSTARLGFASAAMLSVALVVFALQTRTPRPAPATATVITSPAAPISQAEIQRQVKAAVEQAVAATATRQEEHFARVVADIRRQDLEDRRRLIQAADAELSYVMRGESQITRAGYEMPRAQNGGLQ
jgi:hypothetical protein